MATFQQKITCTVSLNKVRKHDGYDDPWMVVINVDGTDSVSVFFVHEETAKQFKSAVMTAYGHAKDTDATLARFLGTK